MSGQTFPTRASDNIYPPKVATVLVVATTTASAATAIPTFMRGRYCTFMADGTDVYILFGTSSGVTCDETQVSGANQCVKLPADQAVPFFIPTVPGDTMTHFALKAASGTPKVRIYASSPTESDAS